MTASENWADSGPPLWTLFNNPFNSGLSLRNVCRPESDRTYFNPREETSQLILEDYDAVSNSLPFGLAIFWIERRVAVVGVQSGRSPKPCRTKHKNCHSDQTRNSNYRREPNFRSRFRHL